MAMNCWIQFALICVIMETCLCKNRPQCPSFAPYVRLGHISGCICEHPKKKLNALKQKCIKSQCPADTIPIEEVCFKEQTVCFDQWTFFREDSICVQIYTTKKGWLDARRVCVGAGGDLVRIETKEFDSFLSKSTTRLRSEGPFWIGLNNFGSDSGLRWLDSDEQPDYLNWEDNLEEVSEPNQKCVVKALQSDGEWNVQSCSLEYSFICERDVNAKTRLPPKDDSSLDAMTVVFVALVSSSLLSAVCLLGFKKKYQMKTPRRGARRPIKRRLINIITRRPARGRNDTDTDVESEAEEEGEDDSDDSTDMNRSTVSSGRTQTYTETTTDASDIESAV